MPTWNHKKRTYPAPSTFPWAHWWFLWETSDLRNWTSKFQTFQWFHRYIWAMRVLPETIFFVSEFKTPQADASWWKRRNWEGYGGNYWKIWAQRSKYEIVLHINYYLVWHGTYAKVARRGKVPELNACWDWTRWAAGQDDGTSQRNTKRSGGENSLLSVS